MAFIFAHDLAGFSSGADAAKAGFQIVSGTYSPTGGRFDGGYWECSNSTHQLTKAFGPASGKVIVQFAVYFTEFATVDFFTLFNNGGTATCAEVGMTAGGALRLLNAAAATVVTSSPVLSLFTWHVIAVEAEIGSAAGTVRVFVDDFVTPVIDESGVDLTDGSATGCDMVRWDTNSSSGGFRLSEHIIYDTSGAAPWNALLGDKRLYSALPNADHTQGWTRSAGATNFDLVDDPRSTTSDADATYVEASAADTVDLYEFVNIPTGVTGIVGVVAIVEAKKTDAGALPSTMHIRMREPLGPTTADSAAITPTTSYEEHQAMFLTEPGGAAWTAAKVNAAQAGPRIAP